MLKSRGAAAVVLAVAAAGMACLPSVRSAQAGPVVVTEAANEVAAAAIARNTGKQVEVTGQRTETARVFVNPSGTRTLEQYLLPVRARKDNGWVPVDTTLVRGSDGVVAPKATVVGLKLSGGGTGPLVTASLQGKEMSLSWPGVLPTPGLAGDTATYAQVLPGVDLRVHVSAAGFAPELVVHDAQAAANPVLRGFQFGTSARGLTVRSDADRTAIVDEKGETVFTGGQLARWERPNEYPMSLGTSFDAKQYRYTLVNEKAKDTSYWDDDYYRKAFRVGWQEYKGESRFRSLFQMNTAQLIGTTVQKAYVTMTLDHSASCKPSPVELWQTRDIDPAKKLTWNNSVPGHWLKQLWTGKGNANDAGGCGKIQPDLPMSFSSSALFNAVQGAADRGDETITFGLRAQNELTEAQWKKFFPATAHLLVEYNTKPRVPTSFSTVPPKPCGTAAAPTALNTSTPSFSAVASDPDGSNVSGQLEILRGDTVLTTLTGATVGSGTAFSWPELPAGVLPEDQPGTVFAYRSRLVDPTGTFGPYTETCYFTVDVVSPNSPTVSSTDFPDGVAVRWVGETGSVAFAATGDDIAGFAYGFSPETPLRVAADQQGKATVPITLWPDQPGGTSGILQRLYVRTVDRADNMSSSAPAWEVNAKSRAVSTKPVRGDTNGDRRADVTQVFDQGYGRTAVWNFLSRDGGFAGGYIAWDTGINGGFPATTIRSARGDFNGDGRSDVAIFREDPGQKVGLYLLNSDGTQILAGSGPAWTGDNKYRLSTAYVVAGDFDGDGDDDIGVFQGYAGAQTKLWMHTSNKGQFGEPVLQWDSGAGKADVRDFSPVSGDFDGDGDDDVAVFRGYPDDQTKLWLHTSNKGQFAAPVQQWDSGLSMFDRERARFLVGNVDGDAAGKDEVVAVYDNGDASVQMITFSSPGGSWTQKTWWSSGEEHSFEIARAVLTAGDFTGDGKTDIAALYDAGDGQRALHTYVSTGSAFGNKRVDWTGRIGDARPEVYVETGWKYRLVAQHSDKCLEVPADKVKQQAVPLQQSDCVTTAKNQTFVVKRIGASPYYTVENAVSGMCVDIAGWSHQDKAAVQQFPCGNAGVPKANQQFRLNYVDGVGLDLVTELRAAHSGKCLDVSGFSQDNGGVVIQWRCGVVPKTNQSYYLRPEL
ncbi:hypothetical protein JOF56_009281 [Kibdelosporangium banguiense]|uniref:Ricin B lectin domain-containing protein n=1 Tax=Kibdelosporangium banguiense TaxID=1365924 RepID=A0ABS4TWY2_9PSEU|nr:RICIN domain-containing protein [Kibdelosporangium banguiense]MBP2328896.1 hypothetical protein [Kibdelosporangium banguiense]